LRREGYIKAREMKVNPMAGKGSPEYWPEPPPEYEERTAQHVSFNFGGGVPLLLIFLAGAGLLYHFGKSVLSSTESNPAPAIDVFCFLVGLMMFGFPLGLWFRR